MADETDRISLHPNTTNELSQHVESHFNPGHGFDDSYWDSVGSKLVSRQVTASHFRPTGWKNVHEDKSQRDTVWNDTWCRISRPASNTGEPEGRGDKERP